MLKRIFDFISALIGLIVLLPFLFIVSMLIKLTSKGSVFYKQERIGQKAKLFTILKFRSMIEDHGDSNTRNSYW